MPTAMPRLVRDQKSGVYFFRLVLPRSLAQTPAQKCLYVSLKTRENKQARAKAALLNLRIEMSKPFIDLDNIKKLIKIDLKNGIFEADTPDEQERGLKILQAMGQPTAAKVPMPLLATNTKQYKFSVVVEEFTKELSATLKYATLYKYKKAFEFFGNYFNDDDISKYTKEDVKAFKSKLLSDGKVAHTINGYIGNLKALFDYSISNGYRQDQNNPAEGLFIKNSKSSLKRRDQFYQDDLESIYDWNTYKKFATKPDYFWAPLICLFSGMRPEEVTSLEVKNFKKEDDIHFIQVKDAKTPAGIRLVPIHSFLIELGLFDYLELVKDREKVFWYLKDGHNGTKKNLSRRFSDYLKDIEVKQDDNCFYSLRHTVITRLVARNISNSTIYVLSGHKSDKSTHYNYLHELPIKSLSDAIEQIDFHKKISFADFNWRLAFTVFD